jgi:hypothetical protein
MRTRPAVLFAVALAFVLSSVQMRGQVALPASPGNSLVDPKTSTAGKPQACSQPEKFVIPGAFAKRAKLKARLANLLRQSLVDDTEGIVNLSREKEIKDLANKLTKEKEY